MSGSLSAHYEAEDYRVRLDVSGEPGVGCVSVQRSLDSGSMHPIDALTYAPLNNLGIGVFYDYEAPVGRASLYRVIFYHGRPLDAPRVGIPRGGGLLLHVDSIAEAWCTPSVDTYWMREQ